MAGKPANAIFASEIEKIAVETNTTINTEDLNIFLQNIPKTCNLYVESKRPGCFAIATPESDPQFAVFVKMDGCAKIDDTPCMNTKT